MMMLWLVRAIGIAAALVFVVALYMQYAQPHFAWVGEAKEKLPGGFGGHVLAMEFVRTGDDVEKIVGPPGHTNRATMRRKIEIDFIWIGCYALLFILVSILLGTRSFPFSVYLAFIAAACGLFAAGFDVVENRGILYALELTKDPPTIEAFRGIREAAILKWTFSFVAMGLLAITFFHRGLGVSLIGYCFAATALVGFIGLWHNPLIGLSTGPLSLGILFLAVQALARPDAFLR
jgi:hypothetical protein